MAEAPRGFEVVFKKAFGSQELTSIPVEAGDSQNVDVEVKLPQGVPAGKYQVLVTAAAAGATATQELLLDVVGQPELNVGGPDGRLSAEIEAGGEGQITVLVFNEGSAEARNVEFSASTPAGWEVAFEPERIDLLPAGERTEVTARITPAERALAGDYVVTVRARGEGASDSGEFRVTLLTSTVWGIVGVLIVAAAVVVLGLAVARYGRR